MTINKLTDNVQPLDIISTINEMIESPGGGGVNVDLSNLSATGESHFQAPLGFTPEDASNKVTSVSSSSTDTQYPSAKSVIELLKIIYPVGSVYLSTGSTCPLSSLFGTWTLVSSGKALWTGTGSNGNTTIAAKLPNIKGILDGTYHGGALDSSPEGSGCLYSPVDTSGTFRYGTSNSSATYGSGFGFDASKSSSIYSDSATTVQPPAYVVNVWRRTA